jgi:nanoRNase/pAp phosphatase (c-di-AMP/oligoRNAs hydrolase)
MAKLRTKGPVRAIAANPLSGLKAKLKGRRAIVTFHSHGDADAAGSAIALYRFIGKNALIVAPDKPDGSARKLMEYTQTPFILFPDYKREPKDFFIVLDSSSPRMLPHLAGIAADLLIDHHSRFPDSLAAKQEIADPTASSTCEMLHFILDTADSISCLALLRGLMSDSSNYKYATARTFEASSELLARCGLPYAQVLSLASMPETFSERIESLRSCQSVRAEKVGDFIVATAMAKSYEAHFADALLHLGADAAFVGCEGQDGRISARMRDTLRGRVYLDRIMFEIGKVLGGSGNGHELAAGATGGNENVREALGICVKLTEQQLAASEKGSIRKIEW